MGIEEMLTAARSQCQNGYAEGLIRSMRRECSITSSSPAKLDGLRALADVAAIGRAGLPEPAHIRAMKARLAR